MLEWLRNSAGKEYGSFIGGEWVAGGTGRYALYNPAMRTQVLGHFWKASSELTDQAVCAAHEAFKTWSQVPGPARGKVLARFADLMERDNEELAFMLSAEQGKPLNESLGEVVRAVKEARFTAGEALRMDGRVLPSERNDVEITVVHRPLGVIAAIAPWNFPIVTPVRKIVPALAYGCTVVYKPASLTPWSSIKLMELLVEAGVPNGVVNLVIGTGAEVGSTLVNHPLVKGISFTGSTSQGVSIQQQAAKRLVPTQLELGGKNPAVVLDCADVKSVAKQIVNAAFACSGQRCTAISRVVALDSVARSLVPALLEEMQSLTIGPAWDPTVNVGPLVSAEQLDTVQEYVAAGIQEGATLAYGGDRLSHDVYADGHYMRPALFTNVTRTMRIAREEIFGPVLSVLTAVDEDDAIVIANDVSYGLAASVFTDRLSVAHKAAESLEAGMVHINHGTASEPHIPFGGVKESGYGPYSIGYSNKEFFTQMKVTYKLY